MYLPTQDVPLSTWALNFSNLITASPSTYGLAAIDASAIQAVVQDYVAKLAIATTEATRTKVTIADKDTARNVMTALIRPYAIIIQSNVGVSQSDKTALGLTLRKTTKTPIGTPSSAPTLSVLSQVTGDIRMSYHNPDVAPKVKSKPAGVIQVELAAATSPTVVTDPATLPFVALVTKSPFHFHPDPSDKGKTVYYAGRWVTRRGLVGPWSAIGSVVVS